MPAANASGYVTVFESSDGGTGDPTKTVWQIFVDNQPVITANRDLAATAQLALMTRNRVTVTYDATDRTLSQVRIQLPVELERRSAGSS